MEYDIKPDKKLAYKKLDNDQLYLHIFYPENFTPTAPHPCIVFFNGGGWNKGSPLQFYSRAKYLASRGMLAICAQYRTKDSHNALPYQCVEDGKSAIRFIRQHASELGIIPDKVAAGGGSAGGHVAAACATVKKFDCADDDLNTSPVPNALVLFNPVYDNGPDGWGYNRVKEYYKDFSPMHNITKTIPPAITFLGDKDNAVPVSTAEKFQKLMKEKGVRSELFIYKDQAHGFFNLGKGGKEIFLSTLEEMDDFLVSLNFIECQSTAKAWIEKHLK